MMSPDLPPRWLIYLAGLAAVVAIGTAMFGRFLDSALWMR